MNKFLKALGFKEPAPPEPKKPRLGITLRGDDYTTFTGDIEWIESLRDRLDTREESYIRGVVARPGFLDGERSIAHESYWIPDVVSYWVDWGDFEPEGAK